MIDITEKIAEFAPKEKSLLCLDVGKKTVGLALSAPPYNFVTPLQTLKRGKFSLLMNDLSKVVHDHDVGGFVIGLPLNMDGSEGSAAQSVRDFAAEMLNYPDVVGAQPWIALQDERLSTQAVYDHVDEVVHKKSTKKNAKQKGIVDSLAAKVILEDAIKLLKN